MWVMECTVAAEASASIAGSRPTSSCLFQNTLAKVLTTVPMATIASYFPLLAMHLATIGSSKLPGTHATYFTVDQQQCQSSSLQWWQFAKCSRQSACLAQPACCAGHLLHSAHGIAAEMHMMPARLVPTSTSSLFPPCRSNASRAPSRSSLVTKSLNLAMTTANLRSEATRLPTNGLPACAAALHCCRSARLRLMKDCCLMPAAKSNAKCLLQACNLAWAAERSHNALTNLTAAVV